MQRQIQTALLMAASLFMDMMDGTIVTSAIPSIARAFSVSESTASLLVSSYIIALAVLIPLSGWLGERYGHKKSPFTNCPVKGVHIICRRRVYCHFFLKCPFHQLSYAAGYADPSGGIRFSHDSDRADNRYGENITQRHAPHDEFSDMAGSHRSSHSASSGWHPCYCSQLALDLPY